MEQLWSDFDDRLQARRNKTEDGNTEPDASGGFPPTSWLLPAVIDGKVTTADSVLVLHQSQHE